MIFFRVSGCCCFDLKTGSLIISGLECFICILGVLVNIFMDLPSITLFLVCIAYSILNILVFFGSKTEKHNYLLPWIITNFTIIIINLGALIWIFVQFFNISTNQPEIKLDVLFLTLLFIFGMIYLWICCWLINISFVAALNIYLWIVIRSRYKEIRSLIETNEEYTEGYTRNPPRIPASQVVNENLYDLSFPPNEHCSNMSANRLENCDAIECQN